MRSDGIYHGLPVFPEHLEGLTAIITGANGISGTHMVRKSSRATDVREVAYIVIYSCVF